MTNIKDIALHCGVAISTVSRVLNDHPDVSEETREKVLRAVQELHYIPNNSARNLVRTTSDSIALLVKGVNNPFFSKIIKAIEREITLRGYTLELHHMDTSEDELRIGAQLANDRKLIGITAMETLMGKQTFAEVLDGLVVKPEGKPTLVPESDPRESIASRSAEADFT